MGVAEDLVQQEDRSLDRRERFHHHEEGHRQRLGELGLLAHPGARVGEHGLGKPFTDVQLAPGAGGAQLVDGQAGRDLGQVGARRGHLGGYAPVKAKEGLLHHVLGLAHAAQHPVGDRDHQGAQVIADLSVGVHGVHL